MDMPKNFRLQFIKHTKLSDHIEYLIRLFCVEDSSISAEFLERYSNLKKLHDALKKEANSINYPKFPEKKIFGNTDEKFLNQRQTALNHYFSTIFGSKEFSQLPSLKKWIDEIVKKYIFSKGKMGEQPIKSVSNPNTEVYRTDQHMRNENISNQNQGSKSFSGVNELQRCKDIVDKCSKNFIDLGTTPQIDEDSEKDQEIKYQNLLDKNSVLNVTSSKLFKIVPGDNKSFDYMGLEEQKLGVLESQILAKLNAVSIHLMSEVPEDYVVDDLIVKIHVNRN